MSWTKFSVNAITEGIIRALRQSNVIADDESAQLLRDMDNSLTETEIDDIITNQVNYGGGDEGLGGVLSSPDDLVMLIDSDAAPSPWYNNKNYFRIGRAQSAKPLSVQHTLASIYAKAPETSTEYESQLTLGPDTNQLTGAGAGLYYPARLFLGAYTASPMGQSLTLGLLATGSDIHSDGGEAFRMHGTKRLEFSSSNTFVAEFTYSSQLFYSGNDVRPDTTSVPYTLGGFYGNFAGGSDTRVFYVSERPAAGLTTESDSLIIRKKDDSLYDISNQNDSTSATDPRPTINLTSFSTEYTGIVAVNANRSVVARDPATHQHPSFSVYGPTSTSVPPVMAVVATKTNFTGTALMIKSYNTISTGDHYNFILARRSNGTGGFDSVFRVNNAGVVYGASLDTSGADVAEYVTVDNKDYAYGTVLCVGKDLLVGSTEAEDPKVAGVVVERPGVLLGGTRADEEPTNKLPMTVCGFAPVRCTTVAGNILPGDLLVSSTEGRAQKANKDPKVGTILGKAFESLEQEGDEPQTGLIKALIILQ